MHDPYVVSAFRRTDEERQMKSVFVAVTLLVSANAFAQTPNGQAIYDKSCASCHQQPGADSRAPNREGLRQFSPESILTALTTGNMYRQGYDLSDAEKKAIAEVLAGRALGSAAPSPDAAPCTA